MCPFAVNTYHGDAVDGTGELTETAAVAPIGVHTVHMLGRADDSVRGTGIRAETAADALVGIDFCDFRRNVNTAFLIQREIFAA